MNSFSQFGIKPQVKGFIGEKIKIEKVLNVRITIHFYQVGPSKYPEKYDQRLDMQIEFNGEKRKLWSSSTFLIDMIKRVPDPAGFPFETTIVKVNDHYEFT